jgi:hypothetical protein
LSDRSIAILGASLVLVAVGWLLFRAYVTPDFQKIGNGIEVQQSEPKRVSRVNAVAGDCSRIGNRTRLQGSVRNTGNTTLGLVTVQSLWKNKDGLVLGTGVVYVVNQSDPLEPGDSRDFEDVTQLSNVTRCNVEPLDWGS